MNGTRALEVAEAFASALGEGHYFHRNAGNDDKLLVVQHLSLKELFGANMSKALLNMIKTLHVGKQNVRLVCFTVLFKQAYPACANICLRKDSKYRYDPPAIVLVNIFFQRLFFSTPVAFPQSLQQTLSCPRLVPHQVCGSNPRIGKKKCFSVVSCVADLNPCVGKCRYYNTDLIFFPLAQGHG